MPDTPSSVTTRAVDHTRMSVMWNITDMNVDTVYVRHRLSGGSWTTSAPISPFLWGFVIMFLSPGTVYEIQTRACIGENCSVWSGAVSESTKFSPVMDSQIIEIGNDIHIFWTHEFLSNQFVIPFDTTTVSDGATVITAEAIDENDNTIAEQSRQVTIANE